MKLLSLGGLALSIVLLASCAGDATKENDGAFAKAETTKTTDGTVDQFADIKILRYEIPGFQNLTLKEQKLVYYMKLLKKE